MARNEDVALPAGAWTQLTNADCTGDISVMLSTGYPVSLQATVGAVTPTDETGPLHLLSEGDGWSEATIVEKFPGVAGANRLYAKPMGSRDSAVGVSHGT